MVQKLDEQGFVRYEKYRGLVLTRRRARAWRGPFVGGAGAGEFFELLGVNGGTAQRDLEGIEHHLNPASVERIESWYGF